MNGLVVNELTLADRHMRSFSRESRRTGTGAAARCLRPSLDPTIPMETDFALFVPVRARTSISVGMPPCRRDVWEPMKYFLPC
jgi:hypothetical protein